LVELIPDILVFLSITADSFDGIDHGGMIFSTEYIPDLLIGQGCIFFQKIHSHLTRKRIDPFFLA